MRFAVTARRPVLALGAVLALQLAAVPARAVEPLRGQVAEAYPQYYAGKVWKMYSPGVFHDGKLDIYAKGEREQASRKQAALMTKLRESSEFRDKFPHLIPETEYDE